MPSELPTNQNRELNSAVVWQTLKKVARLLHGYLQKKSFVSTDLNCFTTGSCFSVNESVGRTTPKKKGRGKSRSFQQYFHSPRQGNEMREMRSLV